jgi:hypothetical protein
VSIVRYARDVFPTPGDVYIAVEFWPGDVPTGAAWRWNVKSDSRWVGCDGGWALDKLWLEADWEVVDDPPAPVPAGMLSAPLGSPA